MAQTNIQRNKHTNGHRDSMTESADSMKIMQIRKLGFIDENNFGVLEKKTK